MKNLLILFVFFYASTSISQELMNFYIEPNGTDEITLHTMVYKNTYTSLGGYEVEFEGNSINVSMCYLNTVSQTITLDTQINNISLPNGYSEYTINIELYGDNDAVPPCSLENMVDTDIITFDYPYNPTLTTYIPDNVFEDYLENLGVGIEDVLETQISLYPNPIKDVLTINNDSGFTINNLKFYNVLGALVLKQDKPTHQLNVSKLESGLYFISLTTDKGNLIKKMIKK
jgi:hypothetical protein